MVLYTSIEIAGILTTYRLAHAFEPVSRPRKLDAQDRKADWNNDDRGSGRHEHNQADQ